MVTAHAHGLPDALDGQVSDTLVGVTEVSVFLAVSHPGLIWGIDARLYRGSVYHGASLRCHPSPV